jgi:hypothetical protein
MLALQAFSVALILAASPQADTARELTLVREGKPLATIVVAAEPSGAAAFAAEELQYHVRKITGASLPIVADDRPVTGPRVLVGRSKATDALGLPGEPLKPQEYLIRYLPDTLVLLGRETGAQQPACPKRANGKFGRALEFDGRRDVTMIETPGFHDQSGTLEAWVWMPAEKQSGCHGTILRLDGGGPWTYHILQRDMNTSRISYTTYDGKEGHGLASGELAEGWHHVAGTFDAAAGKMELRVDGQSVGTTKYVKTTCRGSRLGVGGMASEERGKVGNPFRGRIDEVRVSRTVREFPQIPSQPYTTDDHTTLLLHCDETAGPARDASGSARGAAIPAPFDENATLYAVYDFLERSCDVRWYAPGEIGLVCPTTATLVVRGSDLRRAPAMRHRTIAGANLYLPGPPETVPQSDARIWRLRMRLGGQPFSVCHSFYGYYDRYLKTHPEWFAQGYPGQPPQMCYTHPGFIAQVIQDARDYFDGKGAKPGATAAGDVFGLVPMDNMSWCKCPRCQAELNRAEQANRQFNNGKASDYVFRFVNEVAREIGKSHPGKRIGALAYSDYAYYPAKIEVEPNVVVQLCLHTRNWWCPSMEANDRKVLRQWRERDPKRPLYLWLYYCFPALNSHFGKFHYFPGYFAHSVVNQMRLYQETGIEGLFLENSSECGESYLMDQLEFYVTFKLADRPELDGNQLIDEFFTRYYGAAAGPMKELYLAIEETFSNPKNYPLEIQRSDAHQHQTKELAWGSLGTKERMERFGRLMAQAKASAQTPIEKQRVALFERGQWDYMKNGQP